MLKNFMIGTRLGAGFVVVLLLTLVITGVGMVGVHRMGESLRSMYDNRVVVLAQLAELNRLSLRNRVLVQPGHPDWADQAVARVTLPVRTSTDTIKD